MSGGLPPEAYAATLAGLVILRPDRLERLLDAWEPLQAWEELRAGRGSEVWGRGESPATVDQLRKKLTAAAQRSDPARTWARCDAVGVEVLLPTSDRYPEVLATDLAPPPVLFVRGDRAALDGPRVTVVGTRTATAAGREVAAEMGAGLAAGGVRVVSGLARGIDGWAHRGALSVADGAPPVGVVASGLDVVYPPEHRQLWEDVARRGVLLSEVPPGVPPHPLRFPLRNRILAALGDVVVVVESKEKGGSLITAEQALLRQRTVYAVPGSPRNPSAAGSNQLLFDGAEPVVSPADVLMALGFESPGARSIDDAVRPTVQRADRWALELVGAEPRHVESLVLLSGRPLTEVLAALQRLEEAGAVEQRGGWFERTSRSVRSGR